ncbi:MAG TPA: hypothetical protein VF798_05620, partial [Burkholderiaceae bacterium]
MERVVLIVICLRMPVEAAETEALGKIPGPWPSACARILSSNCHPVLIHENGVYIYSEIVNEFANHLQNKSARGFYL